LTSVPGMLPFQPIIKSEDYQLLTLKKRPYMGL
jgi:hypothetical protein